MPFADGPSRQGGHFAATRRPNGEANLTMSDVASIYDRHRITIDDPESRIELIEGELIEMAPIYRPHASALDPSSSGFPRLRPTC
jgi:hypothetical protein